MINRVVLVGRITKDPILRKTQSGMSVVSFTIACNRRIASQGQDADFINCVAWNKTADFMAQYVKKGNMLGLEGRIQTRNYDDRDGKRVYVTEVVADSVQFLESKKDNAVSNEFDMGVPSFTDTPVDYTMQTQMDNNPSTSFQNDFSETDMLDIASDDLPF